MQESNYGNNVSTHWAFQMQRTDLEVRMHDQADSENTIKDRVAASRRNECCGDQRNEIC